jgi:hypothetical protein
MDFGIKFDEGTSKMQILTASGVAASAAVAMKAKFTIAGYLVQGFTNTGAPVTVTTAVASTDTLTVTPSGGVATDKWYALVWA